MSHIVARGAVDSKGKPSVTSNVVTDLRTKFPGLIITDDTRMIGLKKHYSNKNTMYIDLFKNENDIILYFDRDTKDLFYTISEIERAVQRGEISEERIDNSVKRILEAKGINIK
jgi:beta-N-acetylhexosaminidase